MLIKEPKVVTASPNAAKKGKEMEKQASVQWLAEEEGQGVELGGRRSRNAMFNHPSQSSIMFDATKSRVNLDSALGFEAGSGKSQVNLAEVLKGKQKLALLPSSESKFLKDFRSFNKLSYKE